MRRAPAGWRCAPELAAAGVGLRRLASLQRARRPGRASNGESGRTSNARERRDAHARHVDDNIDVFRRDLASFGLIRLFLRHVEDFMSQTMTAMPALTRLAEDEAIFRDSVYEFADKEIRPLAREMDEHAKMSPGADQEAVRARRDERRGARELRRRRRHVLPLGAGGRVAVARRSVGRRAGRRAEHAGDQRRDAAGAPTRSSASTCRSSPTNTIGAYCLSEAGSGSDAFALATRATEKGDGFAITGRKLWITNGNEADMFIVFANVNPDAGYRGITAFIVDRGTPGFTVGKKEDKLGIRASSTCELLFEDCVVPKSQILGEVGKGYKVAIETLNEGRIGIGAQMLGLAQGALDHTVAYVKERKQFGKPIADFQGVQFQIARMATDVEAHAPARLQRARLRDAGQPFLTEAAMCKVYSSEVAERVASMAINLYGGNGFVKEYPVEKLYRDAKIGQIYEGTTNMQLMTIAKDLL